MNKKRVLYLGWDGSYVLSRLPLVKKYDGETTYLSYEGKQRYQLVDLGREGRTVFGHLKLKMFEVVELEVMVRRSARSKPAKTSRRESSK